MINPPLRNLFQPDPNRNKKKKSLYDYEPLLVCKYCDKMFHTNDDIWKHVEKVHWDDDERDSAIKKKEVIEQLGNEITNKMRADWQFREGVIRFRSSEVD